MKDIDVYNLCKEIERKSKDYFNYILASNISEKLKNKKANHNKFSKVKNRKAYSQLGAYDFSLFKIYNTNRYEVPKVIDSPAKNHKNFIYHYDEYNDLFKISGYSSDYYYYFTNDKLHFCFTDGIHKSFYFKEENNEYIISGEYSTTFFELELILKKEFLNYIYKGSLSSGELYKVSLEKYNEKLVVFELFNENKFNRNIDADYAYSDLKKDLLKANNDDIKGNIKDIIKSLLDTYRMSYNLAKQSFYYVKENKKDVITFIEAENGKAVFD